MSLLNLDILFTELSYEISAHGRYLEMLEKQLEGLIKQEYREARNRFEAISKNYDEAEWKIAQLELDGMVKETIPRFFRSPFIVMLWATYESGIIELSRYIQKKRNIPLSINDINADHFLKKASKYFNHILKFTLFKENEARKRFEILRVLRNCIAHGNGRIEAIRKENVKKIKTWEEGELGISTVHGNIIFSEFFLRETYLITSNSFYDLITRTRESFS